MKLIALLGEEWTLDLHTFAQHVHHTRLWRISTTSTIAASVWRGTLRTSGRIRFRRVGPQFATVDEAKAWVCAQIEADE